MSITFPRASWSCARLVATLFGLARRNDCSPLRMTSQRIPDGVDLQHRRAQRDPVRGTTELLESIERQICTAYLSQDHGLTFE